MPDDRTPAEVADQIASAVREMNHLTRSHDALEYPGDLYSVIANLKLAAERMPQLFSQLGRWLAVENAAGRVAHDQGIDPGEYVSAVTDALKRASDDAETLAASLDTAHEMASGLKANEPIERPRPTLGF